MGLDGEYTFPGHNIPDCQDTRRKDGAGKRSSHFRADDGNSSSVCADSGPRDFFIRSIAESGDLNPRCGVPYVQLEIGRENTYTYPSELLGKAHAMCSVLDEHGRRRFSAGGQRAGFLLE